VTQAPAIENQKQEQPITQSDLGISKQETPSFEKRQLNRQETSQFIPGIEKPSSDYEITLPPTVSPSESPAPTLRSIEAEPKSEDKDVKTEQSIDDMKKSERKEAPEMKKEKDVEKSNKGDEVLQKTITPSINEERILGKDSIKLDTVKVMGKMKKEGKKVKESKDSLKNQPLKKPPVNDEKQPDTSK
jgi:hypothetical protein